MAKEKYVLFHIDGGIGKNIMATAVASAIKKHYPDRKIVVTSHWPAVWINHPDVYRFYVLGATPYFYQDYLEGKDTIVLKQEPYHHQDFLNRKRHCIDVWCEQCGVKYNNEKPKIYLTYREREVIRQRFVSDRPLLLLQTNGGGAQDYPVSWCRDAPLSNVWDIIQSLGDQYNVLHLRREDQPGFDTINFVSSPNLRELFALIEYAHNLLLIDSFAQHTAYAFGRKATVLWPVDNVAILGYPDFHNNIVSNADQSSVHLIDSYLGDYNITGMLHECPFENENIFNVTEVVESVNERAKDVKFVPPDQGVQQQIMQSGTTAAVPSQNLFGEQTSIPTESAVSDELVIQPEVVEPVSYEKK